MGAGKSVALEILERLGAVTLSTDAAVHEIYAEPEVVAAVVERWGEQVAPGGVVDRPAIATAAFASPDERAWLEQLIWPRVAQGGGAFPPQAEPRPPPPRPGGAAPAAPARRRGRDPAAVRGRDGRRLRRDDRRHRRRGRALRARG